MVVDLKESREKIDKIDRQIAELGIDIRVNDEHS